MTHTWTVGRGSAPEHAQLATARHEDEIAPIDADRLHDLHGTAAREHHEVADADSQAIANIVSRLRHTRAMAGLSDDQIEDRAADMYNQLCVRLSQKDAPAQAFAQAAALFGEDPEELRQRLIDAG